MSKKTFAGERRRPLPVFALAILLACAAVLAAMPASASAATGSISDRVIAMSQEDFDEEMSGASIGVQVGGNVDTYVESHYPNANIQQFQSIADTVAALEAGKVDYACAPEPVAQLHMRQGADITYLTPELYTCEDRIALAKGNDELRDKIDEVLVSMADSGQLDAIRKKWCEDGDYDLSDMPVREDGEVLRVAFTSTNEPCTFILDGKPAGCDVEILERVAYELGMRVEFFDMTFSAKLAAITADKVDVGLYVVKTDERAEVMDFSEPLYDLRWVVMTVDDTVETPGFFEGLRTRFEATFLTESRWTSVLTGLDITAGISLGSFALATAGGAGLCAMRCSRRRWLRRLAAGYCRVATGIPVLVWLMILYYIAFRGVSVPAELVAIICFGLVTSAPLSGVFKAGLDAVDAGQLEAALAMGFSQREAMHRVVLPQALQSVWDLYAGQLTALIKGTSVVGYVAITDLTKVSDIIRSRTFDAFFPLVSVALVYFVIIALAAWALKRVARRMDPKSRRPEAILKGIKAR